MSDHRISSPPPPMGFSALARRWQIEHDASLHVWTGVRRSGDGRNVRVIVGRTIDELHAKLVAAEEAEK